jgi:uncharacterized protein (DUF58 family)
VIQVHRPGAPTLERWSTRLGFVGEGDTISLSVGGNGIARLTDARPSGVGGPGTVRTGLPATIRFDLTYEQRGEHRLGPVDVTLTDALGLVITRKTVDVTDDVLVYPSVYRLGGPDGFMQTLAPDSDDQQTFDSLREYAPGDPLRDIHWKSSAKRDELLVAEFDEPTGSRQLWVGARATDGHADAMAAAAATVAAGALREGFAVGLAVPGGTVPPGYGDAHRTRLLETLARTPGGEPERDADVLVSADNGGTTVTVDGATQVFERVRASSENPLAAGGER